MSIALIIFFDFTLKILFVVIFSVATCVDDFVWNNSDKKVLMGVAIW